MYSIWLRKMEEIEWKSHKYLKNKEFEKGIINIVINNFLKQSYLNDEKFAVKYIDYLKRTKTVGKNYILDKLYKKGIDKSIIKSISDEHLSYEEELDKIYTIAEKKYKSVAKKKSKYAKIVYFLQSRGFSNQTVFKIMDMLKENGYKFEDKF